jgi:hypothetical protein
MHNNHQSTPRLIGDCAQQLSWMRRCLKQAITLVYAWGVMGPATTQHLIDCHGLWSD